MREPASPPALYDDAFDETAKRLEATRCHRKHPVEAVDDHELALGRILEDRIHVGDADGSGEHDSLHVLPTPAPHDRARHGSLADAIDADQRNGTQAAPLLARQNRLGATDLFVAAGENIARLHRPEGPREQSPGHRPWERTARESPAA